MNIIERNRIVANTELSVRLATDHEAHEHDTRLLEQLRSQIEPEEGTTKHVRIGGSEA
jgi:hypothetical protein